jgi:hypothetical protein
MTTDDDHQAHWRTPYFPTPKPKKCAYPTGADPKVLAGASVNHIINFLCPCTYGTSTYNTTLIRVRVYEILLVLVLVIYSRKKRYNMMEYIIYEYLYNNTSQVL